MYFFSPGLILAWQSPYQVYTTMETTYIGAAVSPFFSKDVVFEWYQVTDGQRHCIGMSDPFILVPPGQYTAKVSYFGQTDGVGQAFLNNISVLKCGDLFHGNTQLHYV